MGPAFTSMQAPGLVPRPRSGPLFLTNGPDTSPGAALSAPFALADRAPLALAHHAEEDGGVRRQDEQLSVPVQGQQTSQANGGASPRVSDQSFEASPVALRTDQQSALVVPSPTALQATVAAASPADVAAQFPPSTPVKQEKVKESAEDLAAKFRAQVASKRSAEVADGGARRRANGRPTPPSRRSGRPTPPSRRSQRSCRRCLRARSLPPSSIVVRR